MKKEQKYFDYLHGIFLLPTIHVFFKDKFRKVFY